MSFFPSPFFLILLLLTAPERSQSLIPHFFIAASSTTVRGAKYGPANNSTIPLARDAATIVSVRPPIDAPKRTWKRAWDIQKSMLPLLHVTDETNPPNSDLCLACLWWKALSGNDDSSPVFDDGLSYDMLPRLTRTVVSRKVRRFYPRLHHANVEIRTAYLDRLVREMAAKAAGKRKGRVRLISIGSGYDLRSIRMNLEGVVDEATELDREDVVEAKGKMMERLMRRRKGALKETSLPRLIEVDLNDIDEFTKVLREILGRDNGYYMTNIFLFEGVMIYLNESVPSNLLKICADVLNEMKCEDSYLCFADRLENVPGGDEALGREELGRNGWELIDWLPKPGLARHMGAAQWLADNRIIV